MELLIVFAIITILAGLMVVTVTKTKRNASNAKCANNLKQMGLALSQFVSDHGCYPLALNPEFFQKKNEEHHSSWRGALSVGGFGAPSQKSFNTDYSEGVWDCPGSKRPTNWPEQQGYAEYGYNGNGLDGSAPSLGLGGKPDSENNQTIVPVSENDVRAPTATIALGDGFVGWYHVVEDGRSTIWRSRGAKENLGSIKRSSRRHNNKANILFADTHLEPIKFDFLFSSEQEQALRMWNCDNEPHRERIR
jgi:prepilin-type processing-associated H-X9-DG protein